MYWRLAKRIGTPGALTAGLLLVAQPNAKVLLRSGMETPLVIALLIALWLCLDRVHEEPSTPYRWATSGLVCTALMWTRLECLCVIPALLILERRTLLTSARTSALFLSPVVAGL